MGEDYDSDGSNPLYPMRKLEMLFVTIKYWKIAVPSFIKCRRSKLDFILGLMHSDHIGGADEVLNRSSVDTFI